MTLNATGAISLGGTTVGQSIGKELCGTGITQISLNDTNVRTLGGVASGQIGMNSFYGKFNLYTYTVTANKTNFCMRAGAVAAGWNGTTKLSVVVNSGVIISASCTGNYAMTISGAYPNGVTLTNNGVIVGAGGTGGNGARSQCYAHGPCGLCSTPGGGGQIALRVTSPVIINNTSGTIAGGGGGGGGGGAACCPGIGGGSGGGGGRSSYVYNSPGGGGGAPQTQQYQGPRGNSGGTGTYYGAGAGGAALTGGYCQSSGAGGDGGNWGSAGGSGSVPGARGGGGGGPATSGSATYITWSGTGTRYGPIG